VINDLVRPLAATIGTRERAVAEADALLVAGGYGAMSMEAVAQAIGIRKPSLYHHFPGGKDELFVAVVESRTAEDGQRLSEAIADLLDTFARLRAISHYFNSVAERRPYHALRDMAAHLPEQHRDWVLKIVDERVLAPVRAVIDDGVRRRELRRCDPELAALAFVTMMASMGKIGADDPRRAALSDFIVDVFADGLRPANAAPRALRKR
jgi:AcrR family transcriptional regulator